MVYEYILGAGGLTLLHVAQCRPKNSTSIIIANLLSIAIGTIVFWACGYAFAIGNGTTDNSNFFLSYHRFFLIDAKDSEYLTFVTEVLTLWIVIVLSNSGFVCRMRYWIYPLITILMSGFVYPCVRHWTNHQKGWLKDGVEIDDTLLQYKDDSGAGSIHVFAGTVSMLGTILMQPRGDRKGDKFKSLGGQVTPLMLIGGTISFGALVMINSGDRYLAYINNVLASQGGALITFILKRTHYLGTKSSTKALINGALAGLVSCSCLGVTYHPYGGFVVGVVGGLAYVLWSSLLQLCRLDDPTDVVAVHLGAGIWAVLAGPIFQKENGILYTGSNASLKRFGWHIVGILGIIAWTGLITFIFLIIFVLTRIAKYNKDSTDEIGLDVYEHEEPAYPDRDYYTNQNDVVDSSSLQNNQAYTLQVGKSNQGYQSKSAYYPNGAGY